jgi:hypothetical protein
MFPPRGFMTLRIGSLRVAWLLVILILAVPRVGDAQERRFRSPQGSPAKEQRFALVIGNKAYPQGALITPENDASDVASALRRLGFEVVIATNLDPTRFRSTIRRFEDMLALADGRVIAVVFYAGHGVQIQGKNYLLPAQVSYKDQRDVLDFGIEADQLLARINAQEPEVTIMILDACRDSPLPPVARSLRGESGLARMDPPAGTFLAFATSSGSTASDNYRERNGLFTKFLLQHISTPGLTTEQLFRRVRTDVYRASRGQQLPEDSNRLVGGDFFFNVPATPAALEPSIAAAKIEVPVPAKSAAPLPAEVKPDPAPAPEAAARPVPVAPPPIVAAAPGATAAVVAKPAVTAAPATSAQPRAQTTSTSPGAVSAAPTPATAPMKVQKPVRMVEIPSMKVQQPAVAMPEAKPTRMQEPPAKSVAPAPRPTIALAAPPPTAAQSTTAGGSLGEILRSAQRSITYAYDGGNGQESEFEAHPGEASDVLLELPDGAVITMERSLRAYSGMQFDPPIPLAKGALAVGAKWTYAGTFREISGLGNGSVDSSFEVVAKEQLATRAGSFMTYRIRETRWIAGTRYRIERWLDAETLVLLRERNETLAGGPTNGGTGGYFIAPTIRSKIDIKGYALRSREDESAAR